MTADERRLRRTIFGGQSPPLQGGCKNCDALLIARMRLSFFLSAFSLMTATTLTAEKPFDFASTPGKLPKQVVPEEYSVRITPDVEKKTFSGSETIRLNAREAVKQMVLNSAEIQIVKA